MCPDLVATGQSTTALFAATRASEVTIKWHKKAERQQLSFVLPANVESLRIEVLVHPFNDYQNLAQFLKLNKHLRAVTFERLPAQSNDAMAQMRLALAQMVFLEQLTFT